MAGISLTPPLNPLHFTVKTVFEDKMKKVHEFEKIERAIIEGGKSQVEKKWNVPLAQNKNTSPTDIRNTQRASLNILDRMMWASSGPLSYLGAPLGRGFAAARVVPMVQQRFYHQMIQRQASSLFMSHFVPTFVRSSLASVGSHLAVAPMAPWIHTAGAAVGGLALGVGVPLALSGAVHLGSHCYHSFAAAAARKREMELEAAQKMQDMEIENPIQERV